MENDISLITLGYLFARFGVLIAFAYLFYRVLRPAPGQVSTQSLSQYARERSNATRFQR